MTRMLSACAIALASTAGVAVAAPPAPPPAPARPAATASDAVKAAQTLSSDFVKQRAAAADISPEAARAPVSPDEKGGEFTCVSHVDDAQLGTDPALKETLAKKFAQDHCVAKFFGPSFVTSVSTQAGIAFASMTANHHKPLYGAAANASLPILWSWRVKHLTSKLFDPSPEGAAIRTLTLPYTRFHQTWIDAGIEPAVLTMTTFNNQDIAVSTTVLAVLGIRRTYTWWSDPENFASRNSFGIALSLFGGWGEIKPKEGSAYPGVVYGIRLGLGSVQQ